jgi:alanine racemase
VDLAAAQRLTASVSSLEGLDLWVAAADRLGDGASLEFHVEIDSGMGRAGFDWAEVHEWAPAILARTGPLARWTGAYTHFHDADAATRAPTDTQWSRFQQALAALPVPRGELVVHVSNSAAALRWPDLDVDAVRPGIYLYGGHPLTGSGAEAEIEAPRAVAAVRARIVLVRDVPPGSTVGYGATYTSSGPERWATLAIGYGDGYVRKLGNRGCALVHGTRVPVRGRISMDMTVVDVTGLAEVAEGDVAIFIGAEGEEEILVDEVAAQVGTISYEILTGLLPRLPRVEKE